jgi:excinuclease ABC subunit C
MIMPLHPTPPDQLREAVRASCQNRPGVYRMVGPANEVIYVGKSKQLRSRLLSYFRADRGEKGAEIIGHTHRIDWECTADEFSSLLLEMRLIKAWRPRFNVQHKRDAAYCFVKITREVAPRLLVVTEVVDDGARYFGPFRGRARVREVVRELVDLLELRDCAAGTPMRFADQTDLFGGETQPLCLRADLRKCVAPCAARCTRADYLKQVEQAQRFLEGAVDVPLAMLGQRMKEASQRLQFEYAATLRDRAVRLADARSELVALRGTIEALSFVYVARGFAGDDRVYIIRRGGIRAECALPASPAERERLVAEAERLLRHRERASGTILPAQVAEVLLVARWFRLRPDELYRTWRPGEPLESSPLMAFDALEHSLHLRSGSKSPISQAG